MGTCKCPYCVDPVDWLHVRKVCYPVYARFSYNDRHVVAALDDKAGFRFAAAWDKRVCGFTKATLVAFHLSLIHISEPTRPY